MACEIGVAYLKGKIDDLSSQLMKKEDIENSLRHEIMILKNEKDALENISEERRCKLDSTILLNNELNKRLEEEKVYSESISLRFKTLDETLGTVQRRETVTLPKLKQLHKSNSELEKYCSQMLHCLEIANNLLTDNSEDQIQIHNCVGELNKLLIRNKKIRSEKENRLSDLIHQSNMVGCDIGRIETELQDLKQNTLTSLADSKNQFEAVENIGQIAESLQNQLESTEDRNQELEVVLEEYKLKISRYEGEICELREAIHEKETHIANGTTYITQNNEKIDEMSNLLEQEREEKIGMASECNKLNCDYKILEEKFNNLQIELEMTKKDKEILEDENEKRRIEFQVLERNTLQSEKMKELMNEEDEIFHDRWQELRAEQEKLLSDFEELNAKYVECDADLQSSKQKCQLHEVNRKKLINEVGKWRLLHTNEIEKCKALDILAKEYQNKYLSGCEELTKSQEKIHVFQKKLDDTVNELGETKQLVFDLKTSLEESESEAKGALANLANQNVDVGALRAETKILEESKSLTVKQCKTLQDELIAVTAEKDTAVVNLQKQCQTLSLELKDQQSLIDALKEENKQYSVEINRLVSEQNASHDTLTSDAKDLRKQLNKLKREHDSNLIKLKECDKELALKAQTSANLDTNISKLEEEIIKKSNEIEILKNENRELGSVLEQYRSELIETQEQWRGATTDILDQVLKATAT